MSLDLTSDKSTLVQVMAWCRQATSHYLSLCWHRSMLPCGVTRPQWVNVWFSCRGRSQLHSFIIYLLSHIGLWLCYQSHVNTVPPGTIMLMSDTCYAVIISSEGTPYVDISGLFLLTGISQSSIEFLTPISNFICLRLWDIIAHACLK